MIGIAIRYLLQEHLCIGRDAGQRRVDFVSYACRQQADRGKLLAFEELLFELGALGYVFDNNQGSGHDSAGGLERRDNEVQHSGTAVVGQRAVLVNLPHLACIPSACPHRALYRLYQIEADNIAYQSAHCLFSGYAEYLLETSIPGRDFGAHIDNQYADPNTLNDVLEKLLQPRKLIGLLHLGSV